MLALRPFDRLSDRISLTPAYNSDKPAMRVNLLNVNIKFLKFGNLASIRSVIWHEFVR